MQKISLSLFLVGIMVSSAYAQVVTTIYSEPLTGAGAALSETQFFVGIAKPTYFGDGSQQATYQVLVGTAEAESWGQSDKILLPLTLDDSGVYHFTIAAASQDFTNPPSLGFVIANQYGTITQYGVCGTRDFNYNVVASGAFGAEGLYIDNSATYFFTAKSLSGAYADRLARRCDFPGLRTGDECRHIERIAGATNRLHWPEEPPVPEPSER